MNRTCEILTLFSQALAIEMDPGDQQGTGLVHECLRFKSSCEIVTEMTSNFPQADMKQLCIFFCEG